MATVSKESIETKIKSVVYLNAGKAAEDEYGDALSEDVLKNLNLVTICIIILENGFKVEGMAACIDPANYNEQKGRECAYEKAFEKIWEVEGYLLRQAMWEKDETAKALAGFAENSKCEGGGCII
jgi:hypothetical protein